LIIKYPTVPGIEFITTGKNDKHLPVKETSTDQYGKRGTDKPPLKGQFKTHKKLKITN
jgi:hypothetical protein